ncbi:coenzyme F420-reducing hydrogenase beta subunit [Nitrobacteraceae bacterium AZCC 1564]
MRIALRCSQCDSEDPKIISMRNPAHEHYCGRECFLKGQEAYLRWILRMQAEAEAEVAT